VLVKLGVVEQRYDAVKEVLERRGTVTEIAERYGVTARACTTASGATGSGVWPAWWIAPSGGGAVPTEPQAR
jgi:hypothetical protein